MKRIFLALLILTLVLIDALTFHDFFKPGEHLTPVQYMFGLVSIPLVFILSKDLIQNKI